jgi:predicted anti-sigma-YlaC factor YlaD
MKTNDCQTIQLALLAGTPNDSHLETCADCRQFAAAMALATTPLEQTAEPNISLDQAILAHAKQRHAHQSAPIKMITFFFVAAAAVALGFYIWSPKADTGTHAVPGPIITHVTLDPVDDTAELLAMDPTLSELLETVADSESSGEYFDDDLLDMELQLAVLQTEAF